MRIVVTGGAGFIGANVCRELQSRPEVTEIIALDNLSTGSAENLDGFAVELINGSILDPNLLRQTFAGAHAVIHLAARPSVPRSVADPMASHEVNATGTMYVLEACRDAGVPVIAASSSSVYGPTPTLPKHEDMATNPQSPYAASKLAAESYILAYRSSFRIPALVFRLFNVYGPLQSSGHCYAAAIPSFIDAALSGVPLRVQGDGRQTRDFTYVGTVASILVDAAVRRVESSGPVNLAFGTQTSLLDLIDKLRPIVPDAITIVFEPSRTGDVRNSQAANGRLLELFPNHQPMPLADGLQRTVEWFFELRSPLRNNVSGALV